MSAKPKTDADSRGFGGADQLGHQEPFPYVVPAIDAVADADKRAHLNGEHPRPLPRNLVLPWHRLIDAKQDPLLGAVLDALKRMGDDRYRIDTRNILVSYKGDLYYANRIPLVDFLAACIRWYGREGGADSIVAGRASL